MTHSLTDSCGEKNYKNVAAQSSSMHWPENTCSMGFWCVANCISWAVHMTNWTRVVLSLTRAPAATNLLSVNSSENFPELESEKFEEFFEIFKFVM
jgi:hypothetical protein